MAIFFSQKFHSFIFPYFPFVFNMLTDSFLVDKEEILEPARRYVCKDLLNLDCQDSTCFAFFKLFKNEESFGKSFYFSFSRKYFDRNFKCFLSCTLLFLNVMKFENAYASKDTFSITFSNNS